MENTSNKMHVRAKMQGELKTVSALRGLLMHFGRCGLFFISRLVGNIWNNDKLLRSIDDSELGFILRFRSNRVWLRYKFPYTHYRKTVIVLRISKNPPSCSKTRRALPGQFPIGTRRVKLFECFYHTEKCSGVREKGRNIGRRGEKKRQCLRGREGEKEREIAHVSLWNYNIFATAQRNLIKT